MHYKQVLERLCKHHPPSHADFRDCRGESLGGGVSRGYCVPRGADALFRTWSNIFCPILVFHVKKAVMITMASLFPPLLHAFSPSILPGLVQRTLEKLYLESAPYRKLSSTSMVETHITSPWMGHRKQLVINTIPHCCGAFVSISPVLTLNLHEKPMRQW